MQSSPLSAVLQQLRAAGERDGAGRTDGELLTQFLSQRDDDALAALVERHAPMVWGVCRRVLPLPCRRFFAPFTPPNCRRTDSNHDVIRMVVPQFEVAGRATAWRKNGRGGDGFRVAQMRPRACYGWRNLTTQGKPQKRDRIPPTIA